MNFFRSFILTFCICLVTIQLMAQSIDPAKLKNLKAADLTDEQILQMKARLSAEGLTTADFEKQAISAGAQPAEISKLIERMNNLKSDLPKTVSTEQSTRNVTDSLTFKRKKTNLPKDSLTIFGSEIFNNQKISFAPNLNMPTPKNYILSTGDQVIIDIYGYSEATYKLKISPDGTIRIPNVGPISVNGLTIDQAKTRIIKNLQKSGFSGIQNGTTGVQITLGDIRSIKVTLIGEVVAPGTYTLPSLSTVYTALYVSGGPGKNGSFRNIQLIRENKVISNIDVYDFLMKGDRSKDVLLKDQDIIKVNPYQSRVYLNGQVKHPGIFEAVESDKIDNLLNYSSGFSENAYKRSVKIYRVTGREKEILDVDEAQYTSVQPVNGDSIIIGRILERFTNRVSIQGAVFREGAYGLNEGMTLSGLIKKAEGLKEDAYLSNAILFRKNDDLTPSVESIDLTKVLKGEGDLLLRKEDSLYIYSKFKLRDTYTLTIVGEVKKPGEYPFAENMHVRDLVYMAGGVKVGAGASVEIARRKKDVNIFEKNSVQTQIIPYTLKNEKDTLILQPFDEVMIKNDPGYMSQLKVTIIGEVANPGNYAKENMTDRISSLIKRSGGLTASAYPEGATLFRMQKGDTIPKNVAINLTKAMANPGSAYDLILMSGDSLTVPRELQTVSVSGQVFNPSQIMFKPGRSLRYYLTRAGGLNEKALRDGIYVTAANGEISGTRNVLAFRFYPTIKPGSHIIVPEREKRERMSEAAKIGMITSLASTIATIAILIYQATKP